MNDFLLIAINVLSTLGIVSIILGILSWKYYPQLKNALLKQKLMENNILSFVLGTSTYNFVLNNVSTILTDDTLLRISINGHEIDFKGNDAIYRSCIAYIDNFLYHKAKK